MHTGNAICNLGAARSRYVKNGAARSVRVSPDAICAYWIGLFLLLGAMAVGPARAATNEASKPEHAVTYHNDLVPDMPWSIHVVKIQRARHEFEFTTSLGRGERFGMATVSAQLALLPASCGKPVAAINGDFYGKSFEYAGRPRDLQIREGELISSPAGHTCFWIDRAGNPQMTNVFSEFKALWADGTETPLGLNEERKDDSAVLYTSAVGPSSRTSGGIEMILEPATNSSCLPLQVGQIYLLCAKSVSKSGNTPIPSSNMVLSVGLALASRLPLLAAGSLLRISTQTVPNLSGSRVAIGGGPALVRDGKVMQWTGFLKMRHPRTALGWNANYIFLVEVDGRQTNLSIGMTFPELAAYMVKLGCLEAMNLDGGGSATFWFLGSVRNSPSEGEERPAANALVLVKTQGAVKPATE